MWKSQTQKGLEGSLFSIIFPGLTNFKHRFGEEKAAIQQCTCTALLNPIAYFVGKHCPLKMLGDGSIGDLVSAHRRASGIPKSPQIYLSLFAFPAVNENSFPSLKG